MRTSIKAHDGMILTDGNTYGTEIFLAEGMSKEDFHEITLEEYNRILEEQNQEPDRFQDPDLAGL